MDAQVGDADGARQIPIDFERVQQIFELNDTLDSMVQTVIGMLVGVLQPLPSGITKIAFMNKLQTAIAALAEEVKKET